jgi:hypothetical protein
MTATEKVEMPTVEQISNAIIREIRKWDGVHNYGDMVAAACSFSRPLAKRLIRIVLADKRSKRKGKKT